MREASDPEPVSAYQRRKKQASSGEHVCVFYPERLDPSIPLEASLCQSKRGAPPKTIQYVPAGNLALPAPLEEEAGAAAAEPSLPCAPEGANEAPPAVAVGQSELPT